MDKTLSNIIAHNYAFGGECLRALGINIPDSWNCFANLVAYFCSPRGLQGTPLKLLGNKISKEIRDRASPRRSAAGRRPVPSRFHKT
jgi:hypothetical protein